MPGELLSVVIPSYCHETFIVEAIESVVDQEHQNIELILIDENSKDASYEIGAQFEQH
jgi:alpha-1,3-rhamnosyltransferase